MGTSLERSELSILEAEKRTIGDDIQVLDSELKHINDEISTRKTIMEKLGWDINNVRFFLNRYVQLFPLTNRFFSISQVMMKPYLKSRASRLKWPKKSQIRERSRMFLKYKVSIIYY